MNKYVIVSFLENIPVDTIFADSQWPLHVTLIRPFVSLAKEEELIATLTKALEETKSFSLVGISEEMFGPESNIPVVELERTPQAIALNASLKSAFDSSMDKSVPDMYTEFRPHVTSQVGGGITVGGTVGVNSVSLVRYEPGMRYVLATVRLV
jgi:2'-5' RNA ligase